MGCAGRKGWPQDVGVSRAGVLIFLSPQKRLEVSNFQSGVGPSKCLVLAQRIRSRLAWIQAGPHASGCDEPGQVGRSSPKSLPRVPWQARPLCAQAQRGRACQPFAQRLRLALTGRHWRTLPVGPRSAEPTGFYSATHLGRAHGKPGPSFCVKRVARVGRGQMPRPTAKGRLHINERSEQETRIGSRSMEHRSPRSRVADSWLSRSLRRERVIPAASVGAHESALVYAPLRVPIPQAPPSLLHHLAVAHMASPALCSNGGRKRGRVCQPLTRTILVRALAGLAFGKVALRLLLRARASARADANLFFISSSESARRILSLPGTRCTAGTPRRCCVCAGRGNRRGCRGG